MRNDRFDALERFTPLFEVPEPSFEGFLRRRDRTRRNQRVAAGVVAIAIFVAPVAWILANGGWSDRIRTPAGPVPTVAPNDTQGIGLVGLAPAGATPSSPRRGEPGPQLLLRAHHGRPWTVPVSSSTRTGD